MLQPDRITQLEPVEPQRSPSRRGIALCLSGGGFRAALFHLGALRRLNELGVLSQVETISAVSGGSLIAAHLAAKVTKWPHSGEVIPDWDAVVAAPFHAFVQRNLRTGPLLTRTLPANWRRADTAVEALTDRLWRHLSDQGLSDLPSRPRYIISATDMTFGVNWIFERMRVGDYQVGYFAPNQEWSVARAAAASSCFPPVFDPMRIRLDTVQLRKGNYRNADREELLEGLQLTDGGVYDNMGLEPVWKDHETILVSDGGAVFDYGSSESAIGRLFRYPALVGKQASSIRKRWLMASFSTAARKGAYWGIHSGSERKGLTTSAYSSSLIREAISNIRTDLDAFSDAEIAVLENHGYMCADQALDKYSSHLICRMLPSDLPFPDWVDGEDRIRMALEGSSKRTLFGRW